MISMVCYYLFMSDEALKDLELIALKQSLEKKGVNVDRIEGFLGRRMGCQTIDEAVYEYALKYMRDNLGLHVVSVSVGNDFNTAEFWRHWDNVMSERSLAEEGMALAIRLEDGIDTSDREIQFFADNVRAMWQEERVNVVTLSSLVDLVPAELRRSLPLTPRAEGSLRAIL